MSPNKHLKLAFKCCKPDSEDENENIPIILHHGITSCKERWNAIQQDLANKTKRLVYAIDARNHGESEHSDDFNFDILSDDLEHFMEDNNIPKASFIGHSMGGYAVMKLAARAPEKVEKIVIEDVSPKEPVAELMYVMKAMVEEQILCFEESTKDDTESTMNQKLRESIYRTVPMIPDEDREVIQSMKFPMKKSETGFESLNNLKVLAKALDNPPIWKCPDGVFDGEALFVYGNKSAFSVVKDQKIILKLCPKAQFSCFVYAGHEVCARYPERFLECLLKFFKCIEE